MPIIKDPRERAARALEKRRALLRFLREELYTSPQVAAELLGVEARAARATVSALERDGLVKRHPIELGDGLSRFWVIGITPRGQSMAFDPATENVIDRSFEPARFSLVTLKHTMAVQRARIQAVNTGKVKQWVSGDRLAAVKKGIKKPDAVCLTTSGQRIAVEVERSVKSPKAYRDVLTGHLTAMHQGKWSRVIWTCPDTTTRDRVQRLILGIKRLQIAGIDTRIDPSVHHANLAFTTYDMFTDCLCLA
jgi:DNA-binding MarR family transcriptional regulator